MLASYCIVGQTGEDSEVRAAAWETFRPESLGKDTLQPVKLIVGCAVAPGCSAFVSCHPYWGGFW